LGGLPLTNYKREIMAKLAFNESLWEKFRLWVAAHGYADPCPHISRRLDDLNLNSLAINLQKHVTYILRSQYCYKYIKIIIKSTTKSTPFINISITMLLIKY